MTSTPQNLVQVNGITQVSDGYLNSLVQLIQSVVALRAFIGISPMTVYLQGLVSPKDGGQGMFYWNSNSGQTDDGLNTIVPNGVASGAWNRDVPILTRTYSLQVPVTGFSITANSYTNVLALNPAGTLATGTVIFPLANLDGQEFLLTSSQTVTSLTLTPNTGQTILGTITTITASSPAKWMYQLSNKTWYRV
jgi:hypothetical protein